MLKALLAVLAVLAVSEAERSAVVKTIVSNLTHSLNVLSFDSTFRELPMEIFSIRDLRERTGELARTAEAGQLSVVTKHGQPVFIALPFDDDALTNGVKVSLAIKLFRDHVISLGRATKLSGMTKLKFIGVLGAHSISAVNYPASELDDELALLAAE